MPRRGNGERAGFGHQGAHGRMVDGPQEFDWRTRAFGERAQLGLTATASRYRHGNSRQGRGFDQDVHALFGNEPTDEEHPACCAFRTLGAPA